MRNKLLMHLTLLHNIAFLISFNMSFGSYPPELMTYTTTHVDNNTQEITIAFTVPKKDFIYKDFLTISVYEPTVTISSWKANKLPVAQYDPLFKETKQLFIEDFSVSTTVTKKTNGSSLEPVHLYCSYYRQSEKKLHQVLIPLIFTTDRETPEPKDETATEIPHTDTKKTIIPHTPTVLDDYFLTFLYVGNAIITQLRTEHKTHFSLLIILIALFIALLYFLKERLENKISIREWMEVILSLLIATSMAYVLLYLHAISRPYITIGLASCCTMGTGIFYLKKSTELQTGYLRTFCTVIGTLCIYSALFLSFKTMQYADEQFNLF